MYIVLHCAGMPFNGNTIKEKSLGGSETAAYYMALELAKIGHDVTIFTDIPESQDGIYDDVRYLSLGQVTQEQPLGDRFHTYAQQTPHDILIIQRHPLAFKFKYASKLNLWWVHDLGLIRNRDVVNSQMWNIDGVLTVSQYHKDQFIDIYGLEESVIFPLNNGVDPDVFAYTIPAKLDTGKHDLVYISRPERGLEHLVKPGGIMDLLGDDYHLHVCGYDNTTPQMAPYYNSLWSVIDHKPNMTNHGSLTKHQLASLLKACKLMVYPTPSSMAPNFREVSCIAMMEAMRCDLPVVTSECGALPETCEGAGVSLIELTEQGQPNIPSYVDEIKRLCSDKEAYEEMEDKQMEKSFFYDWNRSAFQLMDIAGQLSARRANISNVLVDSIRHSDYYVANKLINECEEAGVELDRIGKSKALELKECYSFTEEDDWGDHYDQFYKHMDAIGQGARPENVDNTSRFGAVASFMGNIPCGSVVLDYGCAHGHYTINLARRYPDSQFVGIDFAEHNIEVANKWASDENISNVTFVLAGEDILEKYQGRFHYIMCNEVLEHVAKPWEVANALIDCLHPGGRFIATTPFGIWESESYKKRWPFREHLWHFERCDLVEMFGHLPDFNIVCAVNGTSSRDTMLGSYVFSFEKGEPVEAEDENGETVLDSEITHYANIINLHRKSLNSMPCQTLSVCMIVKEAENSIINCLDSVKDVIDELIIGYDPTGNNKLVKALVKRFCKQNHITYESFDLSASPIEQGFDAARNEAIEKAVGDWILWLDSDEVVIHANRLPKYLRNNQYAGYAIKQDHYSSDPATILKTDFPAKLFRNGLDIKFFGVVHEHPETGLNESIGKADVIPDMWISHYGYDTEETRRNRFMRNIGLMLRDREKYPERVLAKMLWARDLFQMSRYELEKNGGVVTGDMIERSKEVRELWRELTDLNLRMALDALEYYTAMNQLVGEGFWFSFASASDYFQRPDLANARKIEGFWASREDLDMLIAKLLEESTKDAGHRYL